MKVTKLLAVCKIILSILIIFVKAEPGAGAEAKNEAKANSSKVVYENGNTLYLYGSDLAYVIQDNKNMSTIDLGEKGIENIEEKAFESTNFTKIKLQNNKLKRIKNMTFYNTNVKIINLQKNRIEQIDQGAFSKLVLKRLDLSHNNLSYINNNMFEGLIINGVLNLSFNKITTITHLNVFNENISHVFLQSNKIEFIEKRAFYGMKVNCLNLSFNLLTKIESGMFEGLTIFDINEAVWNGNKELGLNLSNNNLTKIDDNAFKQSTISLINLYGIKKFVFINLQHWGISKSTIIFPVRHPLWKKNQGDEEKLKGKKSHKHTLM